MHPFLIPGAIKSRAISDTKRGCVFWLCAADRKSAAVISSMHMHSYRVRLCTNCTRVHIALKLNRAMQKTHWLLCHTYNSTLLNNLSHQAQRAPCLLQADCLGRLSVCRHLSTICERTSKHSPHWSERHLRRALCRPPRQTMHISPRKKAAPAWTRPF
jgi:hypothetical protein